MNVSSPFPQVICKYVILSDIQTFTEVALFIQDIYKKMGKHEICKRYAVYTDRIVKIIFGFYIMEIFLIALYISASPIFSAKMVLILPAICPGIDITGVKGFWLTVVLQIVFTALQLVIACAFDSLVVMDIANMSMVSSIITHHIDELQELLRIGKVTLDETKHRMLVIIFMHRQYNK